MTALGVVLGRDGVEPTPQPLPPPDPGWNGPTQTHSAASAFTPTTPTQTPAPRPSPWQAAMHFSVSSTAWQTPRITLTQAHGAGLDDGATDVVGAKRISANN